jgi:pimeloyl-ACP methyl ester carboxylesterase
VIEYQVGYARVLAGDQRPFDEEATRALVRRDIDRARDFAAMQNHDALPDDDAPTASLSSIAVATLVIHGTADPMFPIAHGEALTEEIPGATLLSLEGGGHGISPSDRDIVANAILSHSGSTG